MNTQEILANYNTFKEHKLKNRFFKHELIVELINQLPVAFSKQQLGYSVQGRAIFGIKWGEGRTKVMLWSQMHGDEATGTMALFDLVNFLQHETPLVKAFEQQCELLIIPMVNPDGAAVFTRRNAQQIDINRDFLRTATAEGKTLKQARDDFEPQFGFNLHDQTTLWSVEGSLKPATLSFLAPAYNRTIAVNEVREKAMLVIADIYSHLNILLPQQIGLFDDEFEPRAFGDNFQKAGTSTILIEAGGLQNDPEKQQLRQYYFTAILTGLSSIANETYAQQTLENYFAIPQNKKEIFHFLIHGMKLNDTVVSVGINYDECPNEDGLSTFKVYSIQDIGDLSFCDAYHTFDASEMDLSGDITFNSEANFKLIKNGAVILAFEQGYLIIE